MQTNRRQWIFVLSFFISIWAPHGAEAATLAEGERSLIYTTLWEGTDVRVYDGSTLEQVGSVSIGPSRMGLALAPGGDRLYVGCGFFAPHRVYEVNTHTLGITRSWSTIFQPHSLAITPDSSKLYAVSRSPSGAGLINSIDLATGVASTVLIPDSVAPRSIAIRSCATRNGVLNSGRGSSLHFRFHLKEIA